MLAWYTTWDTAKDAAEFAEAAGTMLTRRHPDGTVVPAGHLGTDLLLSGGKAHAVLTRGKDVLLVEGLPGENPGRIFGFLLKVEKETTVVSRSAFGGAD